MKRATKTRRNDHFVLDLHGQRSDEARQNLDYELNAAFMRGSAHGRVICGQGTGTLLRVVGAELARHPLVVEHHRCPEHSGSYVVKLAPRALSGDLEE
jgi:DNA-nicking Smr family endonuclease